MDRRTILIVLTSVAVVAGSIPALAAGQAVPNTPLTPSVETETIATGLSQPLYVTDAPDRTDRLFVLEKRGTVRVIDGGQVQPGFWLDMRDRTSTTSEQGLLGIAFHPDFADNGEVYVSSTGLDGDSRLERYVLEDPATDAPGTAQGEVLLEVDQPFANHNGGHLAFGPDGYLYYSLGDGGSAGDPHGNGQDPTTLLGALLRLDVSPEQGYAIPDDNPFADGGGAAEVWAYGLRNPWRFSFDRATGDLWIGDVGQNQVEEVNREPAGSAGGANYGWNVFEGHLPYTPSVPRSQVTFPVLEYQHLAGECSVTGGYVYQGSAISGLEGAYVFGDLCTGAVYAGVGDGDTRVMTQLVQTSGAIASFGQDADGELYVVDIYGGVVSKLVPA